MKFRRKIGCTSEVSSCAGRTDNLHDSFATGIDLKVGIKVVSHLDQYARPVDGIHIGQIVVACELGVAEERFHDLIPIVTRSVY